VETMFDWGGAPQHEIVFVFAAAFADPAAYQISEQPIRDDAGRARVIWRPAGAVSPPLYPNQVADLITAAS